MGQQPTEEELFQMISEVDEDMSGAIGLYKNIHSRHFLLLRASFFVDFAEFLQVIDNQKVRAAMYNDESDMSNKQITHNEIHKKENTHKY
jgi:hypothetical protein